VDVSSVDNVNSYENGAVDAFTGLSDPQIDAPFVENGIYNERIIY
jgi:hypothetical protein